MVASFIAEWVDEVKISVIFLNPAIGPVLGVPAWDPFHPRQRIFFQGIALQLSRVIDVLSISNIIYVLLHTLTTPVWNTTLLGVSDGVCKRQGGWPK